MLAVKSFKQWHAAKKYEILKNIRNVFADLIETVHLALSTFDLQP